MSERSLKSEERVAFALRALYRKHGYLPYKMSKFEAYDLYAANKDFLVGEGVITFTDTDGKLLALKPDVTLSIIKNGNDNETQKVYYHENVYRISGETKQFKEIPQVGVECIGKLGVYDIYETLCLAAESLHAISENFVLDISHIGILAAVLDEISLDERFNREVMRLLGEKNLHETKALCLSHGVAPKLIEKLLTIVKSYGAMRSVLEQLAPLCQNGAARTAYEELVTLCSLIEKSGFGDKVRFDFSVINDMKYYNGIVFKGFIDGVCEGVLSGGQYDKLLARMGRKVGAIGFAVYLDLLEGFQKQKTKYDIDTLVVYDETTDLDLLSKTVHALIAESKSVRVQQATQQGKIRYKEVLDLRGGGACK
ncbi:MAG: ATP phosphoribosyltransferase regulatory subunit [Clostridia bacterium]|nr:ATP phosphoribosyltransferase regulatory subunit [Clostridia bacterium]